MSLNLDDNTYLKPFLGLLRLNEMRLSVAPKVPRHFFWFQSYGHLRGSDFMNSAIYHMTKQQRHGRPSRDFHSETGIISRRLYDYMKDLPTLETTLDFFESFREFMRGETGTFPAFAGGDLNSYTRLGTLQEIAYTNRLIDEYVDKGDGSSLKTQDFTVIYRMPLYLFVETLVCSLSSGDLLEVVEEYRV